MDSRSDSRPRSMARRSPWRAGLLAVLIAVIGIIAMPAAVQAHTDLASSTPVDGAVLDTPPEAITLTFNEDLLAGSSSIALNDMTGTTVLSGPVAAVGPSITVPWPAGLPGGTYQAAYRVVSADGHPVTGAITFTVAAALGEASTGPSAEISAEASPESLTESSAVPTTSAAAEPVVGPPMGVAGSIVTLGLVVSALVATAVVFVRRGRAQ
jgi:methionine-rich copper-binding protein CopC